MAAAWENKKIWYIIYVYLYYDDDYHLLTAYYVSVILPSALYTLRYSLLKKLCKVGIIVPFYRVGNRCRSAICFKSPRCSNRGLSDSTSPCSLGYTPRSLCVFTTKLGMDLGSSLGLQYKIGEVTAVLSVARAASVEQERGVLSFPFIQMFLLF